MKLYSKNYRIVFRNNCCQCLVILFLTFGTAFEENFHTFLFNFTKKARTQHPIFTMQGMSWASLKKNPAVSRARKLIILIGNDKQKLRHMIKFSRFAFIVTADPVVRVHGRRHGLGYLLHPPIGHPQSRCDLEPHI